MPEKPRGPLPHLLVRNSAEPEPYTYPRPVRGPTFLLPPRERGEHADRLLDAVARVRKSADQLQDRRRAAGIAEDRGLYLEFESDPSFELMLKSLDRVREGIELLAVRERGDAMLATVFVAEGKLRNLERLIVATETRRRRAERPGIRNSSRALRRLDTQRSSRSGLTTQNSSLPPGRPSGGKCGYESEMTGTESSLNSESTRRRPGFELQLSGLSFPIGPFSSPSVQGSRSASQSSC